MGRKKVLLVLPFVWLLFSGCDQTEDFTSDQIAEVEKRESDINSAAPFVPFSDTSIYLDGSTGNSATFRADDFMGGASVSSYSISLWFKMDSEDSALQGSFVQTDFSTVVGLDVSWQKNTRVLKFSHLYSLTKSSVLTTVVEEPREWNHLIVSYSHDGGSTMNTIKMYLNGKLIAEETIQADQVVWDPSRMLEVLPIANLLSPCSVDEMVFWNREVTVGEVQQIYGRGAPGNIDLQAGDFRAWWRFGEIGPLPAVVDESGSYNLRLFGAGVAMEDFAIPTPDPFGGEDYLDPLNDGESGDGTTGGSGGSDPLGGGNGGFGGDLGDNGGSGGDLP